MNAPVDVLAVMRAASSNARLGVDLHLTADAIDAARDNVAELIEALKLARQELDGLPHSLGYEFTHIPKIDAALARVGGAA